MISPYMQEIEYALILSRMIDSVKDDPAQLRAAVYEFARTKLEISSTDDSQRERQAAALETAIKGVEAFSQRQGQALQLGPPAPAAQIALSAPPVAQVTPGAPPAPQQSMAMATVREVTPAPEDFLVPDKAHSYSEVRHILEVRSAPLVPMLARFFVGMLLFAAVAGMAYYKDRLPFFGGQQNASAPSMTDPQQAAALDVMRAALQAAAAPAFPVPSDYGIYALSNDTLSELNLLPGQVPDKRIAMSTPVTQPSRTILPDGKAKFIIFRRDLVGNAPDRIDVRVVARVVRAMTFDGKGKPSFIPVSDAWNIRNVSYEFRVRPIAGHPEMLLVQSEKPDFVLPAGRYVLVLATQGYDFTVAGPVSDPSQCLERTDAANGAFYSECKKP